MANVFGLNERQQEILRLHRVDEYQHHEIAELFGVARQQITRELHEIGEILARQNIYLPARAWRAANRDEKVRQLLPELIAAL